MRNGQPVWANDTRMIECQNSGASEIPPFGLVRVTGGSFTSGSLLQVAQPNSDGQQVLINGISAIPVSGYGVCTRETPMHCLYESGDGTPANGETWGAGSGSYKLRKNKDGFVIEGGASDGVVIARRVESGSAGGTVNGTEDWRYFRQVGTSPFETYYPATMSIPGAMSPSGASGNNINAAPFIVPGGATVDRLAVWLAVVGAAGRKARLAIYKSTSRENLYPNELVVQSGEIATDAGANTFRTDTVSTTLESGVVYWACYLANTGAGATAQVGSVETFYTSIPMGVRDTSAFNFRSHLRASYTYAAYPSTFPAYSSSYLVIASSASVFLRFSA